MPEKLKLEISWGSLWRVLIMVVAVFLVYYLRDVAVTILLSIFVSTAISGIVLKLERYKIPRMVSTIIIFLVAIASLTFVVYTIVPIAIIELNALLNNLDGTVGSVLGPETTEKIRNFINPDLNHLANILLAGSASFFDVLGKLLGGATYFFTVLVLSFYMTVSRDGVANFLRALFPNSMEEKVIHVYERTRRKLSRWFHAQLALSVLVGTAVFIGLTVLGVRYNMILGIVAGLFELIPVVGPIFAGALSIVIAMSDSMTLGFYVFILFLIIQQFENNILVPLMIRKAIDIHPVFVLVSLLGGIQLAGFAGLLLAIPAVLIAQEIFEDWILKKSKSSEGITV